jgi:hypothetical protein
VFNRCANPNFLQVIHKVASLIHLWAYLLPVEQREPLDIGCNRLMAVVRVIFNQGGCTLGALEMLHRFYIACSFFCWLIYAATLIDP